MPERPPDLAVLHVSQPDHGGVAAYVAQAAHDQARRGWRVAVACPPDGPLAARLRELEVASFPWPARRSPGPHLLGEAWRLRRIIDRFDPRVVHLHSAKAGLAGRLPGVASGRGVVFQPHGWSWLAATGAQRSLSRWWERRSAARADTVVCVGSGELQEGRRAGVHGTFHLVRNGVDLRRFRPCPPEGRREARAALGLPPDARLAVCVGRLTRQKGQDVLLRAWPAVRARCPRAWLALVGDGDAHDQLRSQAGPGVLFAPGVPDPRRWLAASDVVVLPSRWEGLPLVALEAMAVGRSVVASAIPGLVEVVPSGAGVLVPVADPAELAGAVAARLADPELADAEGAAAAEASGAFDVEATLSLLAEVTRGVAGGVTGGVGAGAADGVGVAGLSAGCSGGASTGVGAGAGSAEGGAPAAEAVGVSAGGGGVSGGVVGAGVPGSGLGSGDGTGEGASCEAEGCEVGAGGPAVPLAQPAAVAGGDEGVSGNPLPPNSLR
ncbi:glycosyltransferase family 4 protein [Actinomadura kijaniata]|uniref:glycosyltransferase family 4 protein n=1 Tax=Actinomadura kijaniata TaxID=46161 RepID=UPI000834CEC7|nr:glycosyltransferase family 4 protein [Actinomadura kijaniata]